MKGLWCYEVSGIIHVHVTTHYNVPQAPNVHHRLQQMTALQLVTLEIQHCAKPENNTHKLFFVKALTSTEKRVFREIKLEKSTQTRGSNSTFPSHCSYGFVELNKFCKVAIGQRDTDERDYCAAIYYHKVDARHYRIHFAIFLE